MFGVDDGVMMRESTSGDVIEAGDVGSIFGTGARVEFECRGGAGYELTGAESATCDEGSGTWILDGEDPPICIGEPRDCYRDVTGRVCWSVLKRMIASCSISGTTLDLFSISLTV